MHFSASLAQFIKLSFKMNHISSPLHSPLPLPPPPPPHLFLLLYFIVSVYHHSSLACFLLFSSLMLECETLLVFMLEVLFTQIASLSMGYEVGTKRGQRDNDLENFLVPFDESLRHLNPEPNQSFKMQQCVLVN